MVQDALHRGLAELLLADAEASVLFGGQVRDGRLRSPSYADLGRFRLTEGGRPAAMAEAEQPESTAGSSGKRKRAREERRPWRRRDGDASPLVRRWLQVECEAGTAYLALAELPATGTYAAVAGGIPSGELNVLMLPQA